MSCFIVYAESVATVANVLMAYDRKYRFGHAGPLVKRLHAMNRKAFITRYEGRYKADLPNVKEYVGEALKHVSVFTREIPESERAQALQTCRCFLYQCSESDKLIESRLFRDIERACYQIAERLLSEKTNILDSAKWQ